MPAVRLTDSPWRWDHNRHAISVDIDLADGVVVALEACGYAVRHAV
jgi:hypothetical protein